MMKYLLPLLAIAGVFFAGYNVVSSNQPMPVAQAVAEPSSSPYKDYIAGAGLIEAQSQNIAIGTPLPRIVTRVAVKVGDSVKVGTPLFYLDERDTRADLAMKQADLAKAVATVNEVKAALTDSASLEDLAESITDKRAISKEELLKRHNAVSIAQARLDSAKAAVQQAQASIANINTTLERLVVRSPIEGEVLQVNIRAGEFAQAGALTTPLMIVGNLEQMHVRVDIDESDAWRFDKKNKAVAYLRGNRDFKVDLELAYLEPFVIPKRSLTGDSTERVDTRVLQALYSFDRKQLPIYIGQQMDVFIETKTATGKGS
jgi:multidrug efflux pump subunit AcrA (membrane-fusion protein)